MKHYIRSDWVKIRHSNFAIEWKNKKDGRIVRIVYEPWQQNWLFLVRHFDNHWYKKKVRLKSQAIRIAEQYKTNSYVL